MNNSNIDKVSAVLLNMLMALGVLLVVGSICWAVFTQSPNPKQVGALLFFGIGTFLNAYFFKMYLLRSQGKYAIWAGVIFFTCSAIAISLMW